MSGAAFNAAALACKLRKMKFSAMADAFEAAVADPNFDLRPGKDLIAALIDAEWDSRYSKKLMRFQSKAKLRYPEASLDDSIYDPDRALDAGTIESLSSCDWITEGRNLLVTGNAGTGKTYIVNALCVCALKKFLTVRYYKASRLLRDLEAAELETGKTLFDDLTKVDLLVIDDFGLMNLDLDKCRNLFEVIDSREGRRSTIVISQYPISAWYRFFGSNTYADSCMDRLVHDAYRLNFAGCNKRNPGLNKPKGGKSVDE